MSYNIGDIVRGYGFEVIEDTEGNPIKYGLTREPINMIVLQSLPPWDMVTVDIKGKTYAVQSEMLGRKTYLVKKVISPRDRAAAERQLGVRPDAKPDEIKKEFQAMSLKYHPDKGGDAGEFIKKKEAYDKLIELPQMGVRVLRHSRDAFLVNNLEHGMPILPPTGDWEIQYYEPGITKRVTWDMLECHAGPRGNETTYLVPEFFITAPDGAATSEAPSGTATGAVAGASAEAVAGASAEAAAPEAAAPSGVAPSGAAPSGTYTVGQSVMYNSPSYRAWMPATVMRVHRDGRITLDIRKRADPDRIRPVKDKKGGGGGKAKRRVKYSKKRSKRRTTKKRSKKRKYKKRKYKKTKRRRH